MADLFDQPTIRRAAAFVTCAHCGNIMGSDNFAPTHSPFFVDGHITICNDCIEEMIEQQEDKWDFLDRLCQQIDLPFVPREWEQVKAMDRVHPFYKYCQLQCAKPYTTGMWRETHNRFKQLQEEGAIEQELPLLEDKFRAQMRAKWGAYDDEAYLYLEHLYQGISLTQSINGALQQDQAVKICKLSYEIDRLIAASEPVDKALASYEKLVKVAEFTPKNSKNASDLESIGELVKFCEAKGWHNGFYDGERRDIVDETIASMQTFNRRLYTQEVSIGDEITRRIEALRTAQKLENGGESFGVETVTAADEQESENHVYEELMSGEDEFNLEEETNE